MTSPKKYFLPRFHSISKHHHMNIFTSTANAAIGPSWRGWGGGYSIMLRKEPFGTDHFLTRVHAPLVCAPLKERLASSVLKASQSSACSGALLCWCLLCWHALGLSTESSFSLKFLNLMFEVTLSSLFTCKCNNYMAKRIFKTQDSLKGITHRQVLLHCPRKYPSFFCPESHDMWW